MISTLVRADRIWLASLFQSTEDTRYYLNGVYVAPHAGDVHVVATDGHRLAAFHDGRGHTTAPCIIPLPAECRAAIKKAKNREFIWFGIIGEHAGRGRHIARVLDAGEPAMGEADNIEDRLEDELDPGILWSGAIDLIDGEFPDYFKVIPDRRALRGVSAFVDHKILADFGLVAGDMDRKNKRQPIRMFSAGVSEPILVECGRPDFVGIVMPMRAEVRGNLLLGDFAEPPKWARNPSAATQDKKVASA